MISNPAITIRAGGTPQVAVAAIRPANAVSHVWIKLLQTLQSACFQGCCSFLKEKQLASQGLKAVVEGLQKQRLCCNLPDQAKAASLQTPRRH
jgi:hypothetical protein